jgi:cell division protein FtsI (penicillin-binding protein 3)
VSKSVLYTSSPLLASKTPVWRSKFIVAAIALGFVVLASRAAYIQVIDNAFFQKQGEVRFARTLELPANRGRILDRNGQILASSVPAAAIWAIPEDIERDQGKLQKLAKLLQMPLPELVKKLENEDRTFVWLKRQVDYAVAQQIAALDVKGVYQRRDYKRQYPEGEADAQVVGFTNVEDNGQDGIELAFDKELAGKPGSRRVIKDRLGRVVEDIGEQVPPVDGQDIQLSLDSRVQQGWQRGGGRRQNRRVTGHGELPEFRPQRPAQPDWRAIAQPRDDGRVRARLDGEADHDRDRAPIGPRSAADHHRHQPWPHHHRRRDHSRRR